MGCLIWNGEAPGLDALPEQVAPLHEVAIDAPAAHASGGDGRDEMGVERKVTHGCGPGIGHDDANRAQMAEQRVRVGYDSGRRSNNIMWG